MRIVVALSKQNPRITGKCIQRMLQSLAEFNAEIIRAGSVPPLYESGVRYRREAGESFQDCLYVFKAQWADCSNLVTWRVGELIAAGENASVRLHCRIYSNGKRLYHITVRRGDGTIEDPSRLLGMQ